MNALVSKDHIFNIIKQHVREVLPELDGQPISSSSSLEQLGANSMDRADILMDIMASLSLKVPIVQMFGPRNIDELIELLYEKLT